MTDKKTPKVHRFEKEAAELLHNERARDLWNQAYETRAALINAVKISELRDEVSGLREDMGKMQATFGRIADALERSNDIRERELGPIKSPSKIKGLGKP